MAKNIVVFSDGTGQEGGKGTNTNVYKLFNMVLDRSSEQVVFYDRGLGTGWRKVGGNIFGAGISKNIRDCYEFIFENYEAGDQIYLFGFSRGATTVRSLSGFLHLFGVLPKSRPELIKKAYKIYRKGNKKKRQKKADLFIKRNHTMWCKIKFLGVWDTVAALGVPIKVLDVIVDHIPFYKHSFHDLSLSRSIENAYHGLAIDEERKMFLPTLWDSKVADYQTLSQVWFCGVHTDVGGGYKEQELSDISLDWMLQNAEKHGLKIYSGHRIDINGESNGEMHNSRGNMFTKLYPRKIRSWPADTHGKPTIHASVLERTLNQRNKDDPPYKPWILDQHSDYDTEPWKLNQTEAPSDQLDSK